MTPCRILDSARAALMFCFAFRMSESINDIRHISLSLQWLCLHRRTWSRLYFFLSSFWVLVIFNCGGKTSHILAAAGADWTDFLRDSFDLEMEGQRGVDSENNKYQEKNHWLCSKGSMFYAFPQIYTKIQSNGLFNLTAFYKTVSRRYQSPLWHHKCHQCLYSTL